ncbi:diaminopimelate decarboxylase [Thalassospiraceae bacterium LMO-SO8]|nr:diaminopimelate decarboxylase [Alphaproteobacteria bacterium LMO-S08]WND76971.1 diaminopimelate decarboxylase [Thalassospiraceae bacterium LMO-SO8]
MDHFTYKDGLLSAEDVSLADLADQVGTPFYCYSRATLERHFQVFDDALAGLDHTVCYAVKANGNVAVIKTLARLGAGADVVSGGELLRALAAGVPASKIVFSGVGKTQAEMAQALDAGLYQINVESEPELVALSQVAAAKGMTAQVAIRINPDVDAKTHAKITTGRAENKFGIDWDRAPEVYAKARDLPGIDAGGIAVHIGSQLLDLEPYRRAYERLRDVALDLRARGHDIRRLDLGGGLGIPYNDEQAPPPADYGAMVKDVVGSLGCHVTFEPGRLIAGNAGVLVTRVLYAKDGSTRRFVIVDAAMNDLIRPALYDAYHAIVPVAEPAPGSDRHPVDVVGPVCETGDTFAVQRHLPAVKPGDLLAIRSAGAYGAVMASTYNGRPLVPEVLVSGGDHAVVRRRVEPEEFMAFDSLPPWLEG